jgi:tungstate transport system substrate-binding protein
MKKKSLTRNRIKKLTYLILLSFFILYGCKISVKKDLILATTTSVQDSGLLDTIIPIFENSYNYEVKILAVGSGEALKMGERGDTDIILAHDPPSEFILLGPPTDPAGIKGLPVFKAFKRISKVEAPFISRADNSGTHKKEKAIWKRIGIKPHGKWYLEVGEGMGKCLWIASEKEAYILSDRATYIALKNNLNLKIMSEGDKILYNPYHLIIVNPEKFSRINYQGAKDFLHFITSKKIKNIIGNFGKDKYGEPIFYVNNTN